MCGCEGAVEKKVQRRKTTNHRNVGPPWVGCQLDTSVVWCSLVEGLLAARLDGIWSGVPFVSENWVSFGEPGSRPHPWGFTNDLPAATHQNPTHSALGQGRGSETKRSGEPVHPRWVCLATWVEPSTWVSGPACPRSTTPTTPPASPRRR